MRGLLVPVDLTESITVVEHDGTFATMYPLVGTDMLECPSIPLLSDAGHALYVDEEGLLKEDPQVNWRLTAMYPPLRHGQLLYGNGVIVAEEGLDNDIVDMVDAEAWCSRYNGALGRAAEKLYGMWLDRQTQ